MAPIRSLGNTSISFNDYYSRSGTDASQPYDVGDLTVPAAVNAPGEWTFSEDGNLVLTTPGTYNITVNRTLSKTVKMWGAGGGGSSWSAGGAAGAAQLAQVPPAAGPLRAGGGAGRDGGRQPV